MPGFSGKHYNSLDPKGRLIVPAPFREILSTNHSSKLIITNEVFDRCLSAYPVDEWQRLIEKVNQMPQTSDAVKYFMRYVAISKLFWHMTSFMIHCDNIVDRTSDIKYREMDMTSYVTNKPIY